MANYECARCRRFFEKVAFEEICPVCFPLEEEEFKKIKEYLRECPGASSNEIMQVLRVSFKSIKRYLKEDRLEIIGDNKCFIRCELCGEPLNSGRFCGGCYKEGQALRAKGLDYGSKSAYIKPKEEDKTSRRTSIRYRGDSR